MPEIKKPKLLSVEASYDTAKEYINTDRVVIKYTFEEPAYMELSSRTQTISSYSRYDREWVFELEDLEDGDYVVDFTAYAPTGDSVTGADFVSKIPDAQLGFSVDTSAPILSLAQKNGENLDANGGNAAIALNTVITNDDGSYTVYGITEKSAVLTVDGDTAGLTVNASGDFTYEGMLPKGKASCSHLIKAVDSAENASELIVSVINKAGTSFTRIAILADGVEVPVSNTYDEYALQIKNGSSVKLTTAGVSDTGEMIPLSGDTLQWNILYGKDKVILNNSDTGTETGAGAAGGSGFVTIPNTAVVDAVGAGDAAVKASLNLTSVETESGKIVKTYLESYVAIQIEEVANPNAKRLLVAPDPIEVNGITATVAFRPTGSAQPGTSVAADVTLTGTALKAGTHTVGLSSFWDVAEITAPTSVTKKVEAQEIVADTLTFTFEMPYRDVDDLKLAHIFAENPTIPGNESDTKQNMPNATFTADGADTGILSGVSNNMKYKINDGEWINITSGSSTRITKLTPCMISIVEKGSEAGKKDSDAQLINVTKADTPNLTAMQPDSTGAKGSIPMTAIHEYSTDGVTWTAAAGTVSLDAGIYYVRVRANGTVLASANQIIAINGDPSKLITIRYDANGGSGTMSESTATAGEIVILPVCTFTAPEGKRFKEWAIGGIAGPKVSANSSYSFADSTTVYAIWEDSSLSEYTIIKNISGVWKSGDGDLIVTVDADHSKFLNVEVNGTTIGRENYIDASGSTIITLKAEYLKTLAAGIYRLQINFTDGYALSDFVISEKKPSDEPSDEPSAEPSDEPSDEPSAEPGDKPSAEPGDKPNAEPGDKPNAEPSDEPSVEPGDKPSDEPSVEPGDKPGDEPSAEPGLDANTKPNPDSDKDDGAMIWIWIIIAFVAVAGATGVGFVYLQKKDKK